MAEQQPTNPLTSLVSGLFGCAFLAIVAFSGCILCVQTSPRSPGYEAQKASAPSAPAGKIDAAGHIDPGKKLYTVTGVFFGTVVEQVVYDDEKQECVLVRQEDGNLFKLRRSAIRQGNTWFTDP